MYLLTLFYRYIIFNNMFQKKLIFENNILIEKHILLSMFYLISSFSNINLRKKPFLKKIYF